ncbi:MAG: type II toxin-antitoxin system RelE/ParE family toxin [Sphingobacteriaceae bacterium]|nr:type II toxin-antitoxin system RelE/ParE family toxin [Sphingobacteriaceae bacterium]
MEVNFNRKFLKDLSQIPEKTRSKVEYLVFQEIPAYSELAQIQNLKKLKGYKEFYRIRLGDYRIGLKITEALISFERILHRKEIYKLFP